MAERARDSYKDAVTLFESRDPFVLPRAIQLGQDALRARLRAVIVKCDPKGSVSLIESNSLLELGEALGEQNPAFALQKELPKVMGAPAKPPTVQEALELFERGENNPACPYLFCLHMLVRKLRVLLKKTP